MAWLLRWFPFVGAGGSGGGKKAGRSATGSPPRPAITLEALQRAMELCHARIGVLTKRRDDERTAACRPGATRQRKVMHLRIMQTLNAQVATVTNQLLQLEQSALAIEAATFESHLVDAHREASACLSATTAAPADAEDVVDSLAEALADARSVSDLLAGPLLDDTDDLSFLSGQSGGGSTGRHQRDSGDMHGISATLAHLELMENLTAADRSLARASQGRTSRHGDSVGSVDDELRRLEVELSKK
jgi:hypothetical protein